MFKDIRLETERLVIRALRMEDLEALYGIVSQPEVVRYLPEDVMSREDVERTLQWILKCYARNMPENILKFTVGVALREGGELVGWCGLGPLEFDRSSIELYYGLSRPHWGRGIGTEAAGAMLDYGFQAVGLERIVAVVRPENPASLRVLEKIGMMRRGEIRGLAPEHAFFEGVVFFALSREEHLHRWAAPGPRADPHGA